MKTHCTIIHSCERFLCPALTGLLLALFAVSVLSNCTSIKTKAPGAPIMPPETTSEYVLGPEDLIEISVWKDESLTKQIVVRPDGKISFPLIGEIQAGGVTVSELQRRVTEKIAEFAPDPTVTVLVLQVNSNKVYVVGKVNRPGEYAPGRRPDVMQAISMAGGLAPFASQGKIIILRREQGVMRKIPFDYQAVIKGSHLEQNIILHSGDVIVVP